MQSVQRRMKIRSADIKSLINRLRLYCMKVSLVGSAESVGNALGVGREDRKGKRGRGRKDGERGRGMDGRGGGGGGGKVGRGGGEKVWEGEEGGKGGGGEEGGKGGGGRRGRVGGEMGEKVGEKWEGGVVAC